MKPVSPSECRRIAQTQLRALASPAYLAQPGENGGFLIRHCVGNMPKKSEVDVPLNYADYYFLEALLRQRNLLSQGKAPSAAGGNAVAQ